MDHTLVKAQDPLDMHYIRLGRYTLMHIIPGTLSLIDWRPEQEDPSVNEGNT